VSIIFSTVFIQLTSTKYKYPTSNDDTTNNKLAYAEYILHLHIQLNAHNVDECEQTCRQNTMSEEAMLQHNCEQVNIWQLRAAHRDMVETINIKFTVFQNEVYF
jgi:hypothetical protein